MSILTKEISKRYGEQLALDHVSFKVRKGEIVGLIGPNGAGKSTMFKILTGYIPPTSGDVYMNDLDIVEHSLEIRKITGYLPEHNPLYTEMYVSEYLHYVAGLYGLRNKAGKLVPEIILRTGLDIERKKRIGELSKGFRQRIGLAQALIHNPEILILDEPTSGLDPNQIIEIRNLIAELGKEKTVLLSTHIMQEVEAICDRVIIIDKGRIVADEESKKIGHQLRESTQTIIVEFDREIDSEDLQEIQGTDQIKNIDRNRWLIQSSSDRDIRGEIFELAVSKGYKVLSLQKKEKSLEDVFRDLTTS
ncbi:MAG: gliding motility-associated ABC transporter ATP-binding subunit GldA [Bacteroides sp. SM23_62_1]|nr:MAG: gliding motility-associated ABC transporter ATP-binding subunit GldA [Bacteroides sp. SM23_62_1]